MTVSQKLEPAGNGNNMDWFDDITVTDVPKGHFLAVTENNQPAGGATTRNITVQCMAAEWAPGGTMRVDTGLYVRKSGETEVCVKVMDTSGVTEIATNTTAYS